MTIAKNERAPRMLSEARFDTGYPQVFDPQARAFPWLAVFCAFLAGWSLAWWTLTL